jgi:hypothetical protein
VATAATAAAALSGGPLASRLPPSSLLAAHERDAKLLAVSVVLLTGAGVLLAYVSWRRAGAPVAAWLRLPAWLYRAVTPSQLDRAVAARWLLPTVAAASLVASAGTMAAVVAVGHTGAQAAWSGVASLPQRSDQ